MRYIFTVLLFAISLFPQEWVNQNPNFSKYDVTDICFVNRDTGFVTMGPHVYRTFNGGIDLELIYTRNETRNALGQIFYLDSILIVIGQDIIIKSTNFGSSFSVHTFDLGNFSLYKAFFTDSRHGWLQTHNSTGAMRRTTDGGLTWQNISFGSQVGNVFFTDSLNGYGTSSLYETRQNIYKTTNGGLNWTSYPTGYSLQGAPIAFITDSIGFAGSKPHMYTNDAGNTWVLKDTFGITYVKGNFGMNIYMGDYKKTAQITYDLGKTWKEVFTPVNEYGAVFNIADSLTLYCGNLKGSLYKSTDMGKTWSVLTNPAFNLGSAFFTDEEFGFVTGRNNMRTFDGGANWEVLYTKQEISSPYFLNRNKGFASTRTYQGNGNYLLTVLHTFDSGSTWDTLVSFITWSYSAKFYFRDSLRGYMMIYEKLGITSDGGNTWNFNVVASGVNDIQFIDSNYGYMACSNTGFRTSDGGNTWIQNPNLYGDNIFFIDTLLGLKSRNWALMRTTNGGASFYDLINHGQDDYFAHLKFFNATDGIVKFGYHDVILKSTDAGVTWQSIFPVPGANPQYFSIFFPTFYTGWVTGTDGAIFKYTASAIPVELLSFNASQSDNNIFLEWKTASEKNNSGFELFKRTINQEWQKITFIPGFGTTQEEKNYLYTDSEFREGNYSYKLVQIDLNGTRKDLKEINIEIVYPGTFSLSQNYPNPFNPSTIIKYQIPEANLVTIKLFNSIGEEIKVLENSEKEKGIYELSFNASELNLSSGVYIYSITSGEFKDVKKMVVLK